MEICRISGKKIFCKPFKYNKNSIWLSVWYMREEIFMYKKCRMSGEKILWKRCKYSEYGECKFVRYMERITFVFWKCRISEKISLRNAVNTRKIVNANSCGIWGRYFFTDISTRLFFQKYWETLKNQAK